MVDDRLRIDVRKFPVANPIGNFLPGTSHPADAGECLRPGRTAIMKLYDYARAPNARRVRIYLAEKGLTVPTETVDLGIMQHKTVGYTASNPMQRVPALVLDDGTVIAESMAICRYFEALHPLPSLFGTGPEEIALVEMWSRFAELYLFFPVAQAFRHLHPGMKAYEVPQVAAWGEANKTRALKFLPILERQLAAGPFVCGTLYSVADITMLVAIDFMKPAKLAVPPEYGNIAKWYALVSARPSANT
jgi:glutathione S-transferase